MDQDPKATEQRPWGSFTVLDEGPGYKVKRIEVLAGNRLSLQTHQQRDEHWSIVSGAGIFTHEVHGNLLKLVKAAPEELLRQTHVAPGFQLKILKGTKHRIEAIEDLVFIETQLGVCDEDDIERFEDDYGR